VALQGLVGDFVSAVDPHTEADPIAVLVQTLVAFGNLVGRNPGHRIGAGEFFPVLFLALVGPSSSGRKGSSWSTIEWLLRQIDEQYATQNIQGGLASGEGLIFRVRDAVSKTSTNQINTGTSTTEPKLSDPGVSDKRLLPIEEEFSQVIKVMRRENCTLSEVLRKAYDGKDLSIMTKNSPIRATRPHVSVIAHTTRDDVSRNLDEVNAANGFGNRFLWVLARASKALPDGGNWGSVAWGPILDRFRAAYHFARETKRHYSMRDDPDTWAIWERVYLEMSNSRPGLVGAMLARWAPNITRLSIIYALLDRSIYIRPYHLAAALAIWKYSEQSLIYIFGDKWGDKDADKLLDALDKAPNGLTRDEINTVVFQKHKNKEQLDDLLSRLWSEGFIHHRREDTGKRGPKPERWFRGDCRRVGNTPHGTSLSASTDGVSASRSQGRDAQEVSKSNPDQSNLPVLPEDETNAGTQASELGPEPAPTAE
jgi:hypothetical protein